MIGTKWCFALHYFFRLSILLSVPARVCPTFCAFLYEPASGPRFTAFDHDRIARTAVTRSNDLFDSHPASIMYAACAPIVVVTRRFRAVEFAELVDGGEGNIGGGPFILSRYLKATG